MKESNMFEELFSKIAQSIVDGESEVAVELANQAIAEGMPPLDAIGAVNAARQLLSGS
jgi:methanogenic corrinoid protein MtbC1